MGTHDQITVAESRSDAQIGALLDRIHDSVSMVDRLMAMPLPQDNEISNAPEWNAAVARRLEIRLAAMMRSVIEKEPGERRA